MDKKPPIDLEAIPHPDSGYFPNLSNTAAWIVLGGALLALAGAVGLVIMLV